MKKKTVVGIIIGVIIAVVLLVIAVCFFIPINNEQIIITKANWMYGTVEKCRFHVSVTAPDDMKCNLCNSYYYDSDTTCMCQNCSRITSRCCRCGKLML